MPLQVWGGGKRTLLSWWDLDCKGTQEHLLSPGLITMHSIKSCGFALSHPFTASLTMLITIHLNLRVLRLSTPSKVFSVREFTLGKMQGIGSEEAEN